MNDSQEKSYKILERLKALFSKKDNRAKLFFLFLAIFLWLIINLSKEEGYVETLEFPVVYKNLPNDKELLGKPLSRINVRVKAVGFDILNYQLSNFDPIEIDVSNMLLSQNGLVAYWVTNNQKSVIQDQLGLDVEVFKTSPDTIKIAYQKLASKKVPVMLNLKHEFGQFTTLYETPRLQPDSILVIGDEKALASIESISTEELRLDDEEGVFDGSIDLILPDEESLKFSHQQVKVNLRLAKLTESTLMEQLELRALPDSVEVVVFPKQVRIKIQLALSDFDKLENYEVRPFVDVSRVLQKNQPDFLSVQLDPLPEFVRNYSIEPKRVEYIISKK